MASIEFWPATVNDTPHAPSGVGIKSARSLDPLLAPPVSCGNFSRLVFSADRSVCIKRWGLTSYSDATASARQSTLSCHEYSPSCCEPSRLKSCSDRGVRRDLVAGKLGEGSAEGSRALKQTNRQLQRRSEKLRPSIRSADRAQSRRSTL